MNTYEKLCHTTWECKYHIVFIPKYRRKALYSGYLRKHLGVMLKERRDLTSKQDNDLKMRIYARLHRAVLYGHGRMRTDTACKKENQQNKSE